MSIRKIWPTSVSGTRSRASCTQPVPSIAEWVVGSASTANTLAAGRATARVALTFSSATVCTLLVISGVGVVGVCRGEALDDRQAHVERLESTSGQGVQPGAEPEHRGSTVEVPGCRQVGDGCPPGVELGQVV